ncbi:MAG: Transcriptional regulator, IclR family [Rhodospirillales bacterium]|nr:Transcriptional regulator, IclR family [Rhodospirillales bacterium]
MSQQNEPEQARYIVTALRRGLAILHLFRRERRVVTLPEIASALDLSRATAFRLAYTLERDGYLQRLPDSHAFRLGPKVLLLGFDYLHTTEVVTSGRDALNALRDRTGFSAHMCVRDGTDIVYVLNASSLHRMRGDIPVGTRYPCHAVATGRALLFDLSQAELAALYEGVTMQAFSDQTPTTVEALWGLLIKERAQGYAWHRSAFVSGIVSLSAPVRDGEGKIVAAINVSDSETVLKDLDAVRDQVLRAAAQVSAQLGWRES